jgi:uncharacterized protein RhaS with RHS repeats
VGQSVDGVTQSSSYDDAGQLTTDGLRSYRYDANGNLTSAGSDSFTWDWRNRMTSATVNGTTASYSYAGDDTRSSQTVGSTTTAYLWDRATRLPLLVSDGTLAYLHADGILAEIAFNGARHDHLTDALGSVRGLTDGSGAVTATSDYAVFGAVSASSVRP